MLSCKSAGAGTESARGPKLTDDVKLSFILK